MNTPMLFAHPFSSYSQKVFMAFYEKDVPFDLRLLSSENPAAIEERHALWPLDRFPVLRADGTTIAESSIIIEWLDQRAPAGIRLIPDRADAFSLADCAAAPALFYADWVHRFDGHAALMSYFQRLLARPSFARCVNDARPCRQLFPGGAPARDW